SPALVAAASDSPSTGIHALDARADAAQQLPRDRPDGGGDLAHVEAFGALLADDDDLVARFDVDVGHVDHHHVHADGADDGDAPAAHQDHAAVAAPGVDAVGVAGRHHR